MLYLWGLIRCKRAANDAQHRRWVSLPLGEAGLAVRFQFYQSCALMMMSYLGSPCPPKLLLQESTWAKVRPYGAIALAPSGVWILAQSTIRTARCPRSLERATQSSAKAQKVTLSRFSSHHLPFSPVRGPKEVTLLVGARRCDLAGDLDPAASTYGSRWDAKPSGLRPGHRGRHPQADGAKWPQ